MDRRHVVLIVAVAASIGTSPQDDSAEPVDLFWGHANEHALFTLDEAHPTRVWEITAQVELPPEAEASGFTGAIGARARFVDKDFRHDPVTLRLTDCAGAALSAVYEARSTWDPANTATYDAFVDCVPGTPCTRTVCLEITTSNDEHPVDLEWNTFAWIGTDDPAPAGEGIDVPIELTIEEIEP
jgi:hypothetical protein